MTQNAISYNLISRHRTKLMGIAIIWIFLFHSKIYFPENIFFHPFRLLVSSGYGGVDIFFFLSGYGLMHHMLTQKSQPLTFYRKRFLSIYPSYIIASIIAMGISYLLYDDVTFTEVILTLTALGFWVNSQMLYWFIPALLMLYFLFPIFFKLHNKYGTSVIVIIVTFSIIICALLVITENNFYIRFFSRIPVFVLGSHISYQCQTNQGQLPIKSMILNLIAIILFFILLTSYLFIKDSLPKADLGLGYYPFIIGTLPLCLLWCLIIQTVLLIPFKPLMLIIPFLSLCGSLSLEIYLIHKQVVFQLGEIFWKQVLNIQEHSMLITYGNYFEYLAYFLLTFFLALMLRRLSIKIKKLLIIF